ncbi:MAG: MaoC domain protein dehydratase [Subtercola sp.]|jgi:itaconyl-CoA hydratase|nr:MaoC domain protein dehydratase [Subtercola sp.]
MTAENSRTRTAPDLSQFPIRRRGAYLEKFTIGETFEHHWGRTLGEADNTLFSTILGHWSPLYLNAEFARSHGHPKRLVNPFLVLCTVVGLSVEDLSESGGPFVGIEDCVFEAPVYVEDTIRAQSVVLASRVSASRPGHGIVTWQTTAYNQNDELVLRYVRKNLIAELDHLNIPIPAKEL